MTIIKINNIALKNSLKIIFLLFIFPKLTYSIDQNNPYKLMNKIIKKTFNRLQTEKLKIKKTPNLLKIITREELLPYINTKYAASLILGRYYRTINTTQRNSYFSAFYEYLLQIYGQILTFYNSQNYQIEPEKPINNSNLLTIRVMIFNKKEIKPINLDFQWRKNSINGNWQFYDIIIEGVSMIFIKKNEWSNLIRIKGIDELIKQLKNYAKHPIVINR